MIPSATGSSDSSGEPPTTYLWTLYFLAQHHSFLSRHDRALSTLSTALSHTPTLPELYTCKARALKRAGDLIGAANCLNEARVLDGQDRFLNTKCAKYCFRAGLVAQGNEILGMFTKVGRHMSQSKLFCIDARTSTRGILQVPEQTSKTCNHYST